MIGFSSRNLMAIAATSFCAVGIHAQQPKDAGVTVGQEICTAGFIMDEYCIVSYRCSLDRVVLLTS